MKDAILNSTKQTETVLLRADMYQQERATELQLDSAGNQTQISCSRAIDPSKPTSFRNKIQIPRSDMEKYLNCPQRLAAQKLGVSVSTLKRRFYQLKIGRWPYQLTQDRRRKSVWHLINEVETKSEKELCPNTVQTLTRLFSMTLQEQQLLATQNQSSQRFSINGSEPPNFKFMLYVPRSETLTNGIRKKPRRFWRLDHSTSTNNESPKISFQVDKTIREVPIANQHLNQSFSRTKLF